MRSDTGRRVSETGIVMLSPLERVGAIESDKNPCKWDDRTPCEVGLRGDIGGIRLFDLHCSVLWGLVLHPLSI